MLTHLPVIVAIGEITDRPSDLLHSREPIGLMSQALHRAEQDANADLLLRLDSLDIVHQVSWRYDKTASQLCDRLKIKPARAVYGVTGGESPMRYIHEAALRITRGESEIAAVVGAEAQYAVNKAKAAKIELPWTRIAKDIENPFKIEGRLNATMNAHGAIRPIHVYPFYENASHVAWNQSPAEALRESSELYSRFSAVAARNPYSWSTKNLSIDEIKTPARDNRMICYPYTKHMVANPAVNQGAAVILTSYEKARALGIDKSKMIFVLGGAAAMEPRDYLQRDQYARSDAQEVVLNAMRALCDDHRVGLDAFELYSCFPCVPKMTRRVLGLSADATPTVTGGLSFFGAPLNNYMTHATCAMVRELREGHATTGLLYGQGEFVTKHHAIVLSRERPRSPMKSHYVVQSEVDRRRGEAPVLLTDYTGQATIETHTVIYDRDGAPQNGVVIARTMEGARLMARVSATDCEGIELLIDPKHSPIGLVGTVSSDEAGVLHWRA